MDTIKNIYNEYSDLKLDVVVNVSFFVAIFIFVNSIYYPLDWYLSKYYATYQKLEFHRKRYVIKNVLKSVYLALLTVYSSYYMYNMFVLDIWCNSSIYQLGLMYMIPDLVSLMRVPKLPRSTIQHHVTVIF